jgi:cytoskeleton protein RodZ
MSLTLGEKLRQARDERGISISEVAEQTRISPMYLELIENDDYRTLPGGIFNKGFVKSYAKYVGLDEQDALQDYARIVAGDDENPDHQKVYRPEVLTDDRTSSSMIPTVIFAVIILGLMTWGILALVKYIQEGDGRPVAANTNTNPGANANTANPNAPTTSAAPAMGAITVEFRTSGEDISVSANVDGKPSYPTATVAAPAVFQPKQSLEFSYLKLKAPVARLTINGKDITLPSEATDSKGKYIQVRINADTLPQLWQNGTSAPSGEAPANTNTAVTSPVTQPVTAPVTRNTPKPAPSPTAAASTSTSAPTKPTPVAAAPAVKATPKSSP